MCHFEVYLTRRNFTLRTDHRALENLMSSQHLNRRLWRWCLYLQDFSFKCVYRPGAENGVADALSRQGWSGMDKKDQANTTTDVALESDGLVSEGGGDVGRAQQDLTPPT